MNDILMEILGVILTAVVGYVATKVVAYLEEKRKEISAETDTASFNASIREAINIVEIVVNCVAQTYVNSLKSSGTFTKEAQEKAIQTAIDNVKALLPSATITLITATYNDLELWIRTQAESYINENYDALYGSITETTTTETTTETTDTTVTEEVVEPTEEVVAEEETDTTVSAEEAVVEETATETTDTTVTEEVVEPAVEETVVEEAPVEAQVEDPALDNATAI